MFSIVDVVLINKIDAKDYFNFDFEAVKEYITKLISKIDNDEELNKIFDKFKDSIQLDKDKELKVSSLIDEQCFKRQGSMIFPLAQKSVDSREYKIVEGDLSKITIPKQKQYKD